MTLNRPTGTVSTGPLTVSVRKLSIAAPAPGQHGFRGDTSRRHIISSAGVVHIDRTLH